MAARTGRARRPDGTVVKGSTLRMTPEAWEVAEAAAAAMGLSRDMYFEALMAQQRDALDEHGCPAWWPCSAAAQEELPLKSA